jgi:RNA ligase (TIGR02306 family)
MRELVTVQEIKSITPIEDADLIESVHVLGWNIVTSKNLFKVGDKVAYFEVDSFLREGNPYWEPFQPYGQKELIIDGETVKGHVLRTRKIRGVYSQGLIEDLRKFDIDPETVSVGDDLTETLGVVKWEAPIPLGSNIIGDFDTRFAPKTDAIRLQTIIENWAEIQKLTWETSLKIDGASQTLINDNGHVRLFGRNREYDLETAPAYPVIRTNGLLEFIKEHPGFAVQFELAGPGIQSNRLKLSNLQAFVFKVWENRERVNRENWAEVLLANSAPLVTGFNPADFDDPQELIDLVSKALIGGVTKDRKDEGVVFHLKAENKVPSWLDSNAEFKIISNSYLTKFGD